MRMRPVHVTPPDPALAEKAARAAYEAARDTAWRPRNVNFIPPENLMVSVGLREGSHYHRVTTDGASGSGVAALTGDELSCAKHLFPQIIGFGENMAHGQALAELHHEAEEIKVEREQLRRDQIAASRKAASAQSAANAALKSRDEAFSRREAAIAEREAAADSKVQTVMARLEVLQALARRLLPDASALQSLVGVSAGVDLDS
jgi:hypothetical protein